MRGFHIAVDADDDVQCFVMDEGLTLHVEDCRNCAQVFLSFDQARQLHEWLGRYLEHSYEK